MSSIFYAVVLGAVGVSAYLIHRFRKYMQGAKFLKNVSAEDKVVIVTGANTGIGKETVRELAKRGAIIYMACRDMEKTRAAKDEIVAETGNQKIYCHYCDLASLQSIREFVENFKAEQSRLDILINNAGVMRCPYAKTKDGFEMQIGVNHLGHFLLTNLLLDLLKKSSPSRIVVVSSALHKRGHIKMDDLNSTKSYAPGAAYSQSKLANILFTRELAKRLEGTGVTVNSLHPGVVNTELGRHMGLNNKLIRFFASPLLWLLLKTPTNGAQTTLFAALDPDLEVVSGQYLGDCRIEDCAAAGKDEQMAKWLWETSVQLTKLNAE